MIDFGDVLIGQTVGRKFTINNQSEYELPIKTIISQNSDLFKISNPDGMIVPPNQQKEIEILFTPNNNNANSLCQSVANIDISHKGAPFQLQVS